MKTAANPPESAAYRRRLGLPPFRHFSWHGQKIALIPYVQLVWIAAFTGGLSVVQPALADNLDLEWRNPTSGAWESPTNWWDPLKPDADSRAPEDGELVFFDVGGIYTVSFSSSVTNDFHIGSGSVTFALDGNVFNTTGIGNGFLGMPSQFTVLDGEIRTEMGGIADSFNVMDNSMITIGQGALWTAGEPISVGLFGRGELNVVDGGEIVSEALYVGNLSSDARGHVTVDGQDSRLVIDDVFVGFTGGQGFLSVTNGAWVQSDFTFVAPHNSLGEITVEGGDAFLQVDTLLSLGRGGRGKLTLGEDAHVEAFEIWVEDHGELLAFNYLLGDAQADAGETNYVGTDNLSVFDGGQVTGQYLAAGGSREASIIASGESTKLVLTEFVGIGDTGPATLEMADGAELFTRDMTIGEWPSSEGFVTVRGLETTLGLTDTLKIADEGQGVLLIEDGAQVVSRLGVIGDRESGDGLVSLEGDGTKWSVSERLSIGNDGVGILSLWDQSFISATDEIQVGGGTGSGKLTLSEDSSVYSSAVIVKSGGEIEPGNISMGNEPVFGWLTTDDLTVEDGGLVTGIKLLAGYERSASVVASGPGTRIELSGLASIGDEGQATFNLDDGAVLEANEVAVGRGANSEGTVIVSGHDTLLLTSTALAIGLYGDGLLTIQDGATVESRNMGARIGNWAGSVGNALISGEGSTWTSTDMGIGGYGAGTLSLTEGAEVLFNRLHVGTGDGSGKLELWPGTRAEAEVVQVGRGGKIMANRVLIGAEEDVPDTLDVGEVVSVKDGGKVFVNELIVGISSGAQGLASLEGSETSMDVSGDLTVAQQGDGTLVIAAGATVSSFSGHVGTHEGGSGRVVVTGTGSTWTCSENLLVGGGGTGSVVTTAEARVEAQEIQIFPGGNVSGTGIIAGQIVNHGVVSPGESAGTLTIEGDFVQEGPGVMILEIGGNGPGQSDLLAVSGNTVLGGKIVLRFIDGFLPSEGDQFTLMTISGSRDTNGVSFEVENLASGFQFDAIFNEVGELSVLALSDGHAGTSPGAGFESWPILATLPADRRGPLDRNGPLDLPNLLAYAMAINPLTATPEDLPKVGSVNPDDATIRFSYRQGKRLDDVFVTVKISTDLADWGDAVILTETVLEDHVDWQRIEVTVTMPEGPSAFLKLGVSFNTE